MAITKLNGNGWYAAITTLIAVASMSCCITMWAIGATTGTAIANVQERVSELRLEQKAAIALVALNDKRISLVESKIDNISDVLSNVQTDIKTLIQRP